MDIPQLGEVVSGWNGHAVFKGREPHSLHKSIALIVLLAIFSLDQLDVVCLKCIYSYCFLFMLSMSCDIFTPEVIFQCF